MPRFKKILCALEFDQGSLTALRLAFDLAQEGKATLHLLHVVTIPPGPEVSLPFTKMEAAARAKLQAIVRRVPSGADRAQLHVRTGNPDVEILQVAKQIGADLIVMATHGRRGIRHLILGSVAEAVVREAPCPVLTVRPGTPVPKASKTLAGKSRRR